MSDGIIFACIVVLGVVAIAALCVTAFVVRKGSDRSDRHDRVMSLLLTKAINAAVVPDIDQLPRIRAEAGDDPPAGKEPVGAPVFATANSEFETAGEARSDQID